MESPSADLMARWRDGDQEAAEELFRRYADRLCALARSRLSARLARHVDPEDVVQSAYRSFFTGARAGRYALHRSGDLWRLLASITLHKLQRQVERHTAGKRTVTQECHLAEKSDLLGPPVEMLAREPTPEEAAALLDTLESLFRGLDPATPHGRAAAARLRPRRDRRPGGPQRADGRRLLELLKERLRNHKDEE